MILRNPKKNSGSGVLSGIRHSKGKFVEPDGLDILKSHPLRSLIPHDPSQDFSRPQSDFNASFKFNRNRKRIFTARNCGV